MLKILLRLLAIGGFIYLSQDNTFLWWFNAKINTATDIVDSSLTIVHDEPDAPQKYFHLNKK